MSAQARPNKVFWSGWLELCYDDFAVRVLTHVCCAPCLTAVHERLTGEGYELTAHYFNPNIHPSLEYRRRLLNLGRFCREENVPLLKEDYLPQAFFRAVHGREDRPDRCRECYELRLGKTAALAAAKNYHAFTTSLLISPYQFHEQLIEVGQALARAHGVDFLYRDFRPLFTRSAELARARSLYRQKYCGCVFSEHERYAKKLT